MRLAKSIKSIWLATWILVTTSAFADQSAEQIHARESLKANAPVQATPEANFTPVQKKFLETLNYTVGNARTVSIVVNLCNERHPESRAKHQAALDRWKAKNQNIVDGLEARRAMVVGMRNGGNIVASAQTERLFNERVSKSAIKMFSNSDASKEPDFCPALDSLFDSFYYNFATDEMGLTKFVLVVAPLEIKRWYGK